jgi:hypothetical protein
LLSSPLYPGRPCPVTDATAMQSLRSTSLRRLCLSVTASATRRPQNPLLSVLACRKPLFTSPSTRWYSSADQFHHQTHQTSRETGEETLGEVEETLGEVEEVGRCVMPHPLAVHSLIARLGNSRAQLTRCLLGISHIRRRGMN